MLFVVRNRSTSSWLISSAKFAARLLPDLEHDSPSGSSSHAERRFGGWSRRRWAFATALGTAVIAGGAFFYYWLYNDVDEEEEDDDEPFRFFKGLTRHHDATSRALGSPEDAQKTLQAHFENIQRISDGTTLPQMLIELERGLERAASIDLILSELRKGSGSPSVSKQASKLEVWNELKLVTWSRALATVWLTALLDLLLRVQLNILGRHLFFQQNIMSSPRFRTDVQSSDVSMVSEGSQEMFLEYAHYLPERAVMTIVGKLREFVAEELKQLELKTPMDADAVLEYATRINDAFEVWAVEESWADLVLPSDKEAKEYFAGFRSSATPDSEQNSSSADSGVVQGMIEELHMIMKSAKFSAAMLDSVQQTFKHFQLQLKNELNSHSIPLAKTLSKIATASQGLLDESSINSQQWIGDIASLARVKELCGSVYSCGPPPAFVRSS